MRAIFTQTAARTASGMPDVAWLCAIALNASSHLIQNRR
jgi:hypothetical protein